MEYTCGVCGHKVGKDLLTFKEIEQPPSPYDQQLSIDLLRCSFEYREPSAATTLSRTYGITTFTALSRPAEIVSSISRTSGSLKIYHIFF